MYPKLFTLPGGITVTTYGFFLMVGFLSAVWLAMRRAQRVNADPDRVLDVSFFALVFGVGGARAMYVVHYWQTQFVDAQNKFLAIIDIRNGGLEFLGGLLGAAVAILIYLMITRQSIRLYLDILAPGAMWGLAFGRIGCFFNGCCFGGLCVVGAAPHDHPPAWAVQFPYGSPAHMRQWEERRVTVPAELIAAGGYLHSLVPADALRLPVEQREGLITEFVKTDKALAEAKSENRDAKEVAKLERQVQQLKLEFDKLHLVSVRAAQRFPSRHAPERATSVSELEELAAVSVPRHVHPTQLFSSINAFLMAAFLTTVFHRRKRHGVVIGLLFLLYPLARILLEIIRADNPHDVAGLTISQSISFGMSVTAIVYLVVIYKYLPERSPAAERARPVEEKED